MKDSVAGGAVGIMLLALIVQLGVLWHQHYEGPVELPAKVGRPAGEWDGLATQSPVTVTLPGAVLGECSSECFSSNTFAGNTFADHTASSPDDFATVGPVFYVGDISHLPSEAQAVLLEEPLTINAFKLCDRYGVIRRCSEMKTLRRLTAGWR